MTESAAVGAAGERASAARRWRGADSLAGGAEGDGGERRGLQLLWKMFD